MKVTTWELRIPAPAVANWDQAQSAAAKRLVASRGGAMRGPFAVMLHSPVLLDRAQVLGEYLRYQAAIAPDLREFAILVAAREWRQAYEWQVHAPLAEACGVATLVIDELQHGRQPAGLRAEQAAVLVFCQQLHRRHTVDDATFDAVHAILGTAGVVELCALCGYYAMLAMLLNVAGTPPPDPATEVFVD